MSVSTVRPGGCVLQHISCAKPEKDHVGGEAQGQHSAVECRGEALITECSREKSWKLPACMGCSFLFSFFFTQSTLHRG